MRLNIFLAWALLCLVFGCAFKSSDSTNGQSQSKQIDALKLDPSGDSTGDGITDLVKINRGSNPFIAEIPDLKVRFLQNYKIEVTYHEKNADPVKDQKSFVINTDVKDTNPDFKFRVGNIFARNHATKTAASFGRFSSHNNGVIEDHDFSWISYPDIDPKFFNSASLKYRDVFNDQNIIDDIKITLSNQVKLNESPDFKEIKNLSLNFYYLNHETENYELLTDTKIERHFQSGIFESFDVVIDHAPINLIKDSYFKRGEFIISEIDDYEIPFLSINYKTLINRIKVKTIPVLYETPLDEKIYYVAVGTSGVRFQNILKVVFDKNYEVKDNALLKIGQFSNNLSDFTHLKEIQDKDKLGKWFIMTNEFKENYLDHLYKQNDRVVLSFITGSDLSAQENEKIYSYVLKVDGNKSESLIPLGNITPNSHVEFTIRPNNHFGRSLNKHDETFVRNGGSCGNNCTSLPVNCTWNVNEFSDYNESFHFGSDLIGEGEKLYLILNGDSFKLTDLLKDKKILLTQSDIGINIEIPDISKIKDIKDFEENQLSLKVKSYELSDFFGVKLKDVGGYYQGQGGCAFNTPLVAEKFKTQISSDSRDADEIIWWGGQFNSKGWPYKIQKVDSGKYYQEISIGVSSSITNFYN